MAIVGDASIAVDADTGPFDKNLKADVTKSATSVGGIIKGILGAQVLAFGARAGVDFLSGAVEAARESNAVAVQTAAVIKSTGGAANVTAKDIDKLSDSIARKTGIDDEQIAKASNLLLTFTGVRNEVGKGNDIFNQATKIATDMGKALGTDASGSAIQLGKALNDPVKGITALTRVGVTFTDQQKKQIEGFVASGKAAEAQKVILAELSKEFGGSAEAQATAAGRLGVTIGNIKEDIGNKLIPVIDKAATVLADVLPGALDAVGKGFAAVSKAAEPVIEAARQIFAVLFEGDFKGGPFAEDSEFIDGLFKFRDGMLEVINFIQNNFKPILASIAAVLFPAGTAFVLLYTKSERFREVVQGVVARVQELIAGLVEFVTANLPKFEEAFTRVANAVTAVFNTILPIILPIIEGVVGAIGTAVETIVKIVKQLVLFVTNIINGDFAAVFGNLKTIVTTAIGGILRNRRRRVPKILRGVGWRGRCARRGGRQHHQGPRPRNPRQGRRRDQRHQDLRPGPCARLREEVLRDLVAVENVRRLRWPTDGRPSERHPRLRRFTARRAGRGERRAGNGTDSGIRGGASAGRQHRHLGQQHHHHRSPRPVRRRERVRSRRQPRGDRVRGHVQSRGGAEPVKPEVGYLCAGGVRTDQRRPRPHLPVPRPRRRKPGRRRRR